MSRRAFSWLAASVGLAAAVATACSSTPSDPGNFPTPTINGLPSGPGTQTIDASISGSQLLAATIGDIAQAKAFHVVETTVSKGLKTHIDMRYTTGGSVGSITTGTMTLHLIRTGADTYVKAPDAFWKNELNSAQQAKYGAKVHNAWVKVPLLGVTFGQLAAFTDKQQVIEPLIRKDTSKFVRGTVTKIDGVSTIKLTDTANGTTVYVAQQGKPYPIKVLGAKGTSAVADFSDWDKEFTVSPPKGAFTLPSS